MKKLKLCLHVMTEICHQRSKWLGPKSLNDNTEEVMDKEGCFSVPQKSGTVRRFSKIRAKFQSIDGKEHSIIMESWPARVFQHETDHTEGRLYDDPKAGRCSNLIDVC